MKLENKYQAGLIRRLKKIFPECIVLKNDSSYIQGIPDLLILNKDKWATLEVKKSLDDRMNHLRPNQEYYCNLLDDMSFSAFIYPENEEEVLHDLGKHFAS